MQRTSSMRSEMPVTTSGSQSLAKPGSMPLTHRLTSPSSAAWCTGSIIDAGITPSGYCRNTGPLDTTLMPARRIPARAWRPTLPVLHCTTRSSSGFWLTRNSPADESDDALQIGQAHVEVGLVDAAVDLDDLAGGVAA